MVFPMALYAFIPAIRQHEVKPTQTQQWHWKNSSRLSWFTLTLKLIPCHLQCPDSNNVTLGTHGHPVAAKWHTSVGTSCVDMYCGHLSVHAKFCYRFSTLRPRKDGRHFPDDIFKCIFLNENEFRLRFHCSISSDNCLVPTRRQATIWTKDG